MTTLNIVSQNEKNKCFMTLMKDQVELKRYTYDVEGFGLGIYFIQGSVQQHMEPVFFKSFETVEDDKLKRMDKDLDFSLISFFDRDGFQIMDVHGNPMLVQGSRYHCSDCVLVLHSTGGNFMNGVKSSLRETLNEYFRLDNEVYHEKKWVDNVPFVILFDGRTGEIQFSQDGEVSVLYNVQLDSKDDSESIPSPAKETTTDISKLRNEVKNWKAEYNTLYLVHKNTKEELRISNEYLKRALEELDKVHDQQEADKKNLQLCLKKVEEMRRKAPRKDIEKRAEYFNSILTDEELAEFQRSWDRNSRMLICRFAACVEVLTEHKIPQHPTSHVGVGKDFYPSVMNASFFENHLFDQIRNYCSPNPDLKTSRPALKRNQSSPLVISSKRRLSTPMSPVSLSNKISYNLSPRNLKKKKSKPRSLSRSYSSPVLDLTKTSKTEI